MNEPLLNLVPASPPRPKRVSKDEAAYRLCQYLADTVGAGACRVQYREIAPEIGLTASGSVSNAANEATRRGWIKPKPNKTRGLQLTEKGWKRFGPPVEKPTEVSLPSSEIEFLELRRMDAPREPTVADGLAHVPTAELVMELINRGFAVRK